LLLTCRAVFEAEGSPYHLGLAFSALADLENELGRPAQAAAHGWTALRYRYMVGNPGDCAISHFNLAIFLRHSGDSPEVAVAHWLAAAVICHQTADGRLPEAVQALHTHFRLFVPSLPPMPPNFDELCRRVEEEPGVHFRELFDRLPRTRAQTGDEALRKVLEMVEQEEE
jgi:hypothetical protein